MLTTDQVRELRGTEAPTEIGRELGHLPEPDADAHEPQDDTAEGVEA